MELVEVRDVGKGVKVDGIKGLAQSKDHVLPPPVDDPDAWLFVPPVGKHLGIHGWVCLDDGVAPGRMAGNGRVDQAQPKPDVEDVPARLAQLARMLDHQRLLPLHHHPALVLVHQVLPLVPDLLVQVRITSRAPQRIRDLFPALSPLPLLPRARICSISSPRRRRWNICRKRCLLCLPQRLHFFHQPRVPLLGQPRVLVHGPKHELCLDPCVDQPVHHLLVPLKKRKVSCRPPFSVHCVPRRTRQKQLFHNPQLSSLCSKHECRKSLHSLLERHVCPRLSRTDQRNSPLLIPARNRMHEGGVLACHILCHRRQG